MTAHTLKGDRERCLEAGMDEYLSKPIDKEKLRDVIFRQVKRQEKQPEFQQEERMSRTGREDQSHADSGQDKISSYL